MLKLNLRAGLACFATTAALLAASSPAWAQTLYVSNAASNTLSMVPVDTSRPKVDIVVGGSPQAVAVSRDGAFAYTANSADDTVSAIDTASQTVFGTWATGDQPYALALSADGSRLYVANYASGTVSVLHAITGSLLQTLTVGAGPIGLTVSPDGSYLAVSHYSSNDARIFAISGPTALDYATVPLGGWHYAPAFTSGSTMAYFPTSGGFQAVHMGMKSVIGFISVSGRPHAIAVTADDNFYLPDYGSDALYFGSLSNLPSFSSVTVGEKGSSIALNTAESTLYLALYGTAGSTAPGVVKAYSTSGMTNTANYTVGGNPSGVAYSPHDFISVAPAPAPVPTLTEWAMILMGVVLAGFAALTLQRRRQMA